jgi:hypothetical protein
MKVIVFGVISVARQTGSGDYFLGSNPLETLKKESSH